jgi:hypothetical protein
METNKSMKRNESKKLPANNKHALRYFTVGKSEFKLDTSVISILENDSPSKSFSRAIADYIMYVLHESSWTFEEVDKVLQIQDVDVFRVNNLQEKLTWIGIKVKVYYVEEFGKANRLVEQCEIGNSQHVAHILRSDTQQNCKFELIASYHNLSSSIKGRTYRHLKQAYKYKTPTKELINNDTPTAPVKVLGRSCTLPTPRKLSTEFKFEDDSSLATPKIEDIFVNSEQTVSRSQNIFSREKRRILKELHFQNKKICREISLNSSRKERCVAIITRLSEGLTKSVSSISNSKDGELDINLDVTYGIIDQLKYQSEKLKKVEENFEDLSKKKFDIELRMEIMGCILSDQES